MLQVDLAKLKKVTTPLVEIRGRPVKVEGCVELSITLREKNKRKMVRQSFMVAMIDTLYLASHYSMSEVQSFPLDLLMKFKIDKGIASIRDGQLEVRGCTVEAKVAMK